MSSYFNTRYADHPGRPDVWRAVCEYLQRFVPANADVLDLGAGRCDFINHIVAARKLALDSDGEAAERCGPQVHFVHESAANPNAIEASSVDVVFASNFLEHFEGKELDLIVTNVVEWLRPGGRLILIQPNYQFCYRTYWDDYTHRTAFSHLSLPDFLTAHGLNVAEIKKRFLPFSFRSRLPKSYWVTKAYLCSPWKPLAAQMLVIADKDKPGNV